MSLPAPITISQQSLQIVEAVGNYFTANQINGKCIAASNLRDMWEQASQSTSNAIVYVCWTGDSARGPNEIMRWTHRVDREWSVLVKRGRGFYSTRGDSLNMTKGNEIPFYDVTEAVRDSVRRILSISQEGLVEFNSIRPWQLGNIIIDAYLMVVKTANDMPMITSKPQNQTNP